MGFKDVIKKINPINNSIEFDSTLIKWRIKPEIDFDVNDIKESIKNTVKNSTLHFEFKQDFKDADIELKIKIDGELESFTFKPGVNPVSFNVNLKKEFKESDITIQLNINGDTSVFTSPYDSDNFIKSGFSFHKKL